MNLPASCSSAPPATCCSPKLARLCFFFSSSSSSSSPPPPSPPLGLLGATGHQSRGTSGQWKRRHSLAHCAPFECAEMVAAACRVAPFCADKHFHFVALRPATGATLSARASQQSFNAAEVASPQQQSAHNTLTLATRCQFVATPFGRPLLPLTARPLSVHWPRPLACYNLEVKQQTLACLLLQRANKQCAALLGHWNSGRASFSQSSAFHPIWTTVCARLGSQLAPDTPIGPS